MAIFAKAGSLYDIGLQELGVALIRETFREAAKYMLGFTANLYEVQSLQHSVLFIRGSGLEATIATFGIDFDADRLRNQFTWHLRHAQSSSATTLGVHSSNIA